jgi:putative spermidine/putrescine transport system ATP-binding protein
VRPEKIRMLDDGDASPGATPSETGRIREVVYVGAFTRYVVDLDAGGTLTVVHQNLERSSAQALEERGRRVRLEWQPEHAYAIEGGEEAPNE